MEAEGTTGMEWIRQEMLDICLAVWRTVPHSEEFRTPPPCPEGEQSFPLPHTEKLIHSLEPECHLSAFEWIDAFLSPHLGLPTTHLM